MTRLRVLLPVLAFLTIASAAAQVEYLPIEHPVYPWLERMQARGLLGNFSLAELPLPRGHVSTALLTLRSEAARLDAAELSLLEQFEREFGLKESRRAAIFAHGEQQDLFFDGLFSDSEKSVYFDSTDRLRMFLQPLGAVEQRIQSADSSRSVLLGQGGLRFHGTVDDMLGFYLQVTNGAAISGEKSLALEDPRLSANVKFGDLDSDFDFAESHIRIARDWFGVSISRMRRLSGAGYFNRIFIGNLSPPMDALSVEADFENFAYRFMHASLVGSPQTSFQFGPEALIPAKYMAYHRFALRGGWGQVSFTEQVMYSDRNLDLAYLNPLSFFKSIEHSLRDRDNSALGLDATIRPLDGLELRAAFFLDDLQFGRIGDEFSGNKTAWNVGLMLAPRLPLDAALEYSRVRPYTYSHFNVQNSITNDQVQLGGFLPPNSDQLAARMRWWYGGRYPVTVEASFRRHGRNIYAADGETLIKNVGGDVLQARRSEDSEISPFLDGDVERRFALGLAAGWEFIRGFNVHAAYRLDNVNGAAAHNFSLAFAFEDF